MPRGVIGSAPTHKGEAATDGPQSSRSPRRARQRPRKRFDFSPRSRRADHRRDASCARGPSLAAEKERRGVLLPAAAQITS